jgi:hypothetical protein
MLLHILACLPAYTLLCLLTCRSIFLCALETNSQEISMTSSALARPQPIRQGNFQEIKTSLRK